jgi:hypothetical protein
LELSAFDERGAARDVHVYEAYWAPFTEGRVTLRDVVTFLLGGARDGINQGWKPFRRWLFGQYAHFPSPVRTVLYLIVAAAVIISLAVLNTIIVTMAAAQAPFVSHPGWLTRALFSDVTTILNVVLAVYLMFGVSVLASMWRHAVFGWVSIITCVLALWATITAGVVAVMDVAYHVRSADGGSPLFGGPRWREFDLLVGAALLGVTAVAGVIGLVRFIWRVKRAFADNSEQKARTFWMLAACVLIGVGVAWVAVWVGARAFPAAPIGPWLRRACFGISWPLMVGVAWMVRGFLIQYVGDVAVFVQSNTLDRFYDLRQQIKSCVWKTAHAVYSQQPAYESIVMVGHSLGSVLIYDTLNQLLSDEVLVSGAPSVAVRTELLLTFGSPLDKTAFLFGAQGGRGQSKEAREALAAAVQPLISRAAVREEIPWINIFSSWDLISGSLDYYDLPKDATPPGPARVRNIPDPEATTLLAAHTEYWQNALVYRTILKALHCQVA